MNPTTAADGGGGRGRVDFAPDESAQGQFRQQFRGGCTCTHKNPTSHVQYAPYVYQSKYDPQACNTPDYSYPGTNHITLAVGSLASCQSPVSAYSGVYDLNGNVWEWEDFCDIPNVPGDVCICGGGSFLSGESIHNGYPGLCNTGATYSRNGAQVDIGFRCCSSP